MQNIEITCVHEHSVCLSLLPEKANILDLGCRGFQFTNYFLERGHRVESIDIDILPEQPYWRRAISGYNGWAHIEYSKDPQATRLDPTHGDTYGGILSKRPEPDIECLTVEKFSKSFSPEINVDLWDILKSDIEGSEYEMIMSWKKPWCKQLSYECHCHTGAYGRKEAEEMKAKLESLGYELVKHEWTNEHGAGYNFWDNLAILK